MAIRSAVLLGVLFLAVARPAAASDEEAAWWKTARARIEGVLAKHGRTLADLESPPWFEVPYSTVGRMPLDRHRAPRTARPPRGRDVGRRPGEGREGQPLRALEPRAGDVRGRPCRGPSSGPAPTRPRRGSPRSAPAWSGSVHPCGVYLGLAVAASSARRHSPPSPPRSATPSRRASPATSSVRPAGRRDDRRLHDGHEPLPRPDGPPAEGRLREARHGGEGPARAAGDEARALLAAARLPPTPALLDPAPVLRRDAATAPSPSVGLGGDTWTKSTSLFLDIGGDDLYLNHPAAASLPGSGAAIHVDLSGNDVYRAGRFAQGSAIGGTALFMDLAGDDQYVSGHYSQGAALGGTALFYEGGGDDDYVGDFGGAVLRALRDVDLRRSGAGGTRTAIGLDGPGLRLDARRRDPRRGAAATTVWRAGGRQGFYGADDAACAQGAASGMRPWPPNGKMTLYGGIGFLSEAGGNDAYEVGIIGQGGELRLLPRDVRRLGGQRRLPLRPLLPGRGVHLSAGVAVDRAGDDVRTGFYGNDGYSLDRCSGVFVDFAGDDVYRTLGGIGFGHKPKGTGIFVDVKGKDTYAGTGMNYGKADVPSATRRTRPASSSTSAGGRLREPRPRARPTGTTRSGRRARSATARTPRWRSRRRPRRARAPWRRGPSRASAARLLAGRSALERLTALDPAKAPYPDSSPRRRSSRGRRRSPCAGT